jgi:hypothetical protein
METSRYGAFIVSLRLYGRPLTAAPDLKMSMSVHMGGGGGTANQTDSSLCNIEWLLSALQSVRIIINQPAHHIIREIRQQD